MKNFLLTFLDRKVFVVTLNAWNTIIDTLTSAALQSHYNGYHLGHYNGDNLGHYNDHDDSSCSSWST